MGGPPATRSRDHPVPASAWSGVRRLRHPDGRMWEVRVQGREAAYPLVESDGEKTCFNRPLVTGWKAEALVAALQS